MARPKEFDRDQALGEAIRIFADHGFAGTSTDALLAAMRIGRQSLYDTFGDKRRLYLEALQRYNAESVAELIAAMNSARTPLAGLAAMLDLLAARPAPPSGAGCLGVSSICEFGRADHEIALVNDASASTLRAAIERQLAAARDAGETAADLDPKTAARFIGATLGGIRLAARDGATPEMRRGIAAMAIHALR